MKLKFIEGARHWWRMWSIQLAMVFAAFAAWLTTTPSFLQQLIALIPPDYRWLAPIVTFAVSFAIPTISRLVIQPKLAEKANGDKT